MNYFNILHLVAGFSAFFLAIANIAGPYQPTVAGENTAAVLLAAALVNLMAVSKENRRKSQLIASVLLLVGIVAAFGYTSNNTLAIAGLSLDQVALIALSIGTIALVVIDFPSAFPYRPSATDQRESGSVKWFNVAKGFGFITRDSGDDVFVHYRALRGEGHKTLTEGQRVEFVVVEKEKGLQAEDVSIVD